ncbi:tetrathionate reductase family octaheme c-type cytochrome [Phototrophicus methaneseepsis]|uniref:tetrathionate reductase family octaheme c-type cytochrome n=1 Tax=Phototrophicus methaneseepsis TaxID=2710758 RepID=UPI001E4741DC|nr:tetrathionate reductase family octaheme c-type cytochrome [Phototrophicus methaneseepsis]
MIHQRFIWIFGLLGTGLIVFGTVFFLVSPSTTIEDDPWANVPIRVDGTDHSNLITGALADSGTTLETGPDVTRLCLTCHEDAAHEVMDTVHWTWQSEPIEVSWRDEPVSIGKANTLNNFCIGIQSNEAGCTRCHAGYGWSDDTFDFTTEDNTDCLVCHDQSGTYVKASAGLPAEGVDLISVAQSVGTPTRENCGGCHFNGGGGNGVKHGDLDESLYFPTENVDVHMGRYDFLCVDCHETEQHQISGRSISVSVDNANQVACTDCHTADLVHGDERITAHLDTVACQTCHVPAGALRDATKMEWDWSTAGDPDREENIHEYLRIKGSFVYERNFMPDYLWYDGTAQHYILGDEIDPNEVAFINKLNGSIDDPNSMIWPFKVHDANQPYDTVYNILLQPNTVGPEGYWTLFDWDLALQNGAEAAGIPYSGEYGFTHTQMFWPQTHMVQPAENALQCTDCHSDNGRFDWEALGYIGDPMTWGGRDSQ